MESPCHDPYDLSRKRFARLLLPYLLQLDQVCEGKRRHELRDFWKAAFEVIFDRYPPPTDDSGRIAEIQHYIKNDAVLYLTLSQLSSAVVPTKEWKLTLNIQHDRAKRRVRPLWYVVWIALGNLSLIVLSLFEMDWTIFPALEAFHTDQREPYCDRHRLRTAQCYPSRPIGIKYLTCNPRLLPLLLPVAPQLTHICIDGVLDDTSPFRYECPWIHHIGFYNSNLATLNALIPVFYQASVVEICAQSPSRDVIALYRKALMRFPTLSALYVMFELQGTFPESQEEAKIIPSTASLSVAVLQDLSGRLEYRNQPLRLIQEVTVASPYLDQRESRRRMLLFDGPDVILERNVSRWLAPDLSWLDKK
ncbi:hypothetical protein ONZ45_g10699 [Pleurotus djamor]|nr:hypothetical protein ONZ45_g10699 [Pleurotus djamor]